MYSKNGSNPNPNLVHQIQSCQRVNGSTYLYTIVSWGNVKRGVRLARNVKRGVRLARTFGTRLGRQRYNPKL